jgi:hypothetical protein
MCNEYEKEEQKFIAMWPLGNELNYDTPTAPGPPGWVMWKEHIDDDATAVEEVHKEMMKEGVTNMEAKEKEDEDKDEDDDDDEDKEEEEEGEDQEEEAEAEGDGEVEEDGGENVNEEEGEEEDEEDEDD